MAISAIYTILSLNDATRPLRLSLLDAILAEDQEKKKFKSRKVKSKRILVDSSSQNWFECAQTPGALQGVPTVVLEDVVLKPWRGLGFDVSRDHFFIVASLDDVGRLRMLSAALSLAPPNFNQNDSASSDDNLPLTSEFSLIFHDILQCDATRCLSFFALNWPSAHAFMRQRVELQLLREAPFELEFLTEMWHYFGPLELPLQARVDVFWQKVRRWFNVRRIALYIQELAVKRDGLANFDIGGRARLVGKGAKRTLSEFQEFSSLVFATSERPSSRCRSRASHTPPVPFNI